MIEERKAARGRGDFETADRIRDALLEKGISVHDSKIT
jgi:cysteinyl-tRNA synthetase